jgi:hypothetical protein
VDERIFGIERRILEVFLATLTLTAGSISKGIFAAESESSAHPTIPELFQWHFVLLRLY